jgi:ABC-type transport system involved in cytochrome c biogenesis permease subunit
MNDAVRQFRDFFVSLKLTVALLALSIVLIFWATVAQVDLGIWAVQEKFFRSFFVFGHVGEAPVPVFPGGYFIGGLLLINLIAAHIYRFKLTWRKTGIFITHVGLILLLIGELLSGLLQEDFQMRLEEGQTKNYSESYRLNELAIIDTTDPKTDEVVAIPEEHLARGETIQYPKLPFRVATKVYYPNAMLQMRDQAPNAPPSPATTGFGQRLAVTPLPVTYKQDEHNFPTAAVELIGPEGSLGTWLVSTQLGMPQRFDYGGRTWEITFRPQRSYKPFQLTLLKFSHDVYPGTNIPKNFSSRIRVSTPDGRDDREVLIYMNNPLRYAGLTFYQASFEEGNDKVTILQVVRNPGWMLPYISCLLMALGLMAQFGMHLFGFADKRSSARSAGAWTGFPTVLTLVMGALLLVVTLMPPRNPAAFDVVGFGQLPVLANGRIKPLDTVARTSLLQIEGRQAVITPSYRKPTSGELARSFFSRTPLPEECRALTPTEWLLDVGFRGELADTYQTFRIVHPDVLALFDLTTAAGRSGKYFAFNQLTPKLDELERQARLAEPVESAQRTPFQRAVLQLYNDALLYQRLKHAFVMPGNQDFLGDLLRLPKQLPEGIAAVRAKRAGEAHDEKIAAALLAVGEQFNVMAEVSNLLVVPPADNTSSDWKTAGAALLESFQTGQVDPIAVTYAGLGQAWRQQNTEAFNHIVELYRASLEKRFGPQLAKSRTETRFNHAAPFTKSFILYAVAFFAAIFSWLAWPNRLGRAAFTLVALAWLLATAGILTRMWLEDRPPVTNLYSSALFVGWVAVALCLALEWIYRNAIGAAAAGLVGFATLIIADRLSQSGDTLEMMRAVLDSNFWLATHVVVVASGYAATFLAGFLALIYIFRGMLTASLDKATADALTRMVYGIVCFATLFSFTGTVLGGIWADQSWGRFWGWDPKENGALIIVIWNALILHARWGGMVKQRGLMCLAVFGNAVTSWSWFGTNMLGVGLHSYGFTEAAFWVLTIFVLSQLAIIGLANLPLEKWRSFRPAAVTA